MNLFTQSKLETLQIAMAKSHRDPALFNKLSAVYLKKIKKEDYSFESLLLINHLLNQDSKDVWSLFLHKLKNIDFIYLTQRFNDPHLNKTLKVHPEHIQQFYSALIEKIHHIKHHHCPKTLSDLGEAKDTITADRIIRITRFCPELPNLKEMSELLANIHNDAPLMHL